VVCYERAVALKPSLVAAQTNLGSVLYTQGKLDEAVVCLERALELRPNYAEAHSNLGSALQASHKLNEAVACYERALALKPDRVEVLSNLGTALHEQDKLDEAVACFERALAVKPDFAEPTTTWAASSMRWATWMRRWRGIERLLLSNQIIPKRVSPNLWPNCRKETSPLAGATMNPLANERSRHADATLSATALEGPKTDIGPAVALGEQGIGDEIMFAGLLPDVIRTGNRCVLDSNARLRPLFARSFPGVEVISGHGPELDICRTLAERQSAWHVPSKQRSVCRHRASLPDCRSGGTGAVSNPLCRWQKVGGAGLAYNQPEDRARAVRWTYHCSRRYSRDPISGGSAFSMGI